MKFIGLQENLKRGLNIVGHLSSKNINLPILNNILIKAVGSNIELISTNLEIGISHLIRGKVELEGEFTVDSKLISEYVNLLNSGEKVLVDLKGDDLKIECGNYKTRIKGESSKEYPLIPTISRDGYFSCDLVGFKKALTSVVFSVSNSENRAELTGVLFSFTNDKLFLAATDSYRLAEKEINIKRVNLKTNDDQKVIVPSKTIQETLRVINGLELNSSSESLDEVKIYISDNQILFVFDSVEIISRLISGYYPDYKQIIPSKSQTQSLMDRAELIRAVKAAALFSKTGINDITIILSKSKLLISSFSGSSGESQVEIKCEVNGDDNEITINYRYLLDGLNNIDSRLVRLNVLNNFTPCVIKPEKSDDYLYIVMPIRQ